MKTKTFLAAALCAAAAVTAHAARTTTWTFINLGSLHPTGGSIALAVNNRGDIAGTTSVVVPGNFAQHAFLWQNGLMQDLGIGRIVAEVRNDKRIALLTAINGGERARPRTAVEALWKLNELRDPG